MDSLLGGIKDVSGGVIGTCFVVDGHLFGTTLPGYSGQQEVTRAAEAFRVTLSRAEELGLVVSYTTVTFGDTRVLFADLGGPVLAVFHQEETDVGVLTQHLEEHREDLLRQARSLVKGVSESRPPPVGVTPPVTVRSTAPPTHLKLPPPVEDAGSLTAVARELDDLHQALLLQVGPAALALMDDALDRWLQGGRAERGRLQELVDHLSELLPSRRLRERFRAELGR